MVHNILYKLILLLFHHLLHGNNIHHDMLCNLPKLVHYKVYMIHDMVNKHHLLHNNHLHNHLHNYLNLVHLNNNQYFLLFHILNILPLFHLNKLNILHNMLLILMEYNHNHNYNLNINLFQHFRIHNLLQHLYNLGYILINLRVRNLNYIHHKVLILNYLDLHDINYNLDQYLNMDHNLLFKNLQNILIHNLKHTRIMYLNKMNKRKILLPLHKLNKKSYFHLNYMYNNHYDMGHIHM